MVHFKAVGSVVPMPSDNQCVKLCSQRSKCITENLKIKNPTHQSAKIMSKEYCQMALSEDKLHLKRLPQRGKKARVL